MGEVLLNVSSKMTPEEIEKRSRVQKRGRFSNESTEDITINESTSKVDIIKDNTLFDIN